MFKHLRGDRTNGRLQQLREPGVDLQQAECDVIVDLTVMGANNDVGYVAATS